MQPKITIDHQEIIAWAQKYSGSPQIIDDQQVTGDTPAIRIDFPGRFDEAFIARSKLQEASWDTFFMEFERQQLAIMYMEEFDLHDLTDVYKSYQFIKREVVENKSDQEINQLLEDFRHEFNTYVGPGRPLDIDTV